MTIAGSRNNIRLLEEVIECCKSLPADPFRLTRVRGRWVPGYRVFSRLQNAVKKKVAAIKYENSGHYHRPDLCAVYDVCVEVLAAASRLTYLHHVAAGQICRTHPAHLSGQ